MLSNRLDNVELPSYFHPHALTEHFVKSYINCISYVQFCYLNKESKWEVYWIGRDMEGVCNVIWRLAYFICCCARDFPISLDVLLISLFKTKKCYSSKEVRMTCMIFPILWDRLGWKMAPTRGANLKKILRGTDSDKEEPDAAAVSQQLPGPSIASIAPSLTARPQRALHIADQWARKARGGEGSLLLTLVYICLWGVWRKRAREQRRGIVSWVFILFLVRSFIHFQ